MLVGLVFAVVLARGSILKAVMMIVLGLLLSTVGTDVNTGQERLTFGIGALVDRIDFAVLAMGLFGIAELLRSLENPEARDVVKARIGSVLPSWAEIRTSLPPIFRGIGLGTVLGALPGNGAVLAPFGSYALEKKIAKDPTRFGKGAIEGVAGPESANNAGAQAAFIPLLTLGIPPNAVMALMVGAMTIHGIVPGPQVMTRNPELFWGMIASMWVGNLALLIINLPLPYRLMFPAILAFCCIGVYSINNQPADIVVTAFFGLVGYGLLKLGFELAPLLLGFVLGGLIEDTFRRAMDLSHGSMMTFVERPVSLGLLLVGAVVLGVAALPTIAGKREKAFVE
jgi:putative tricarboxylic transport membrane protein